MMASETRTVIHPLPPMPGAVDLAELQAHVEKMQRQILEQLLVATVAATPPGRVGSLVETLALVDKAQQAAVERVIPQMPPPVYFEGDVYWGVRREGVVKVAGVV
jgi:hypothetical protein